MSIYLTENDPSHLSSSEVCEQITGQLPNIPFIITRVPGSHMTVGRLILHYSRVPRYLGISNYQYKLHDSHYQMALSVFLP